MNATNGYLYATKTEMPCVECTLQIQYRAEDVGRLKTRVSRKRAIKLVVKSLPLGLFKISSDDVQSSDQILSSDEQYRKTFDLDLANSTISGVANIFVNEDTKIGEKIYKLNVKPRAQNSYLAPTTTLTYFSLLDEGNLNQTFYMANHDGSLYLIKPVDFESPTRVYNLTVVCTNWVGQIEYARIQVNVRDVNDNQPKFENIMHDLNKIIYTNEEEDKTKSFQLVDLMLAHDLDELDRDKLVYKIEDCFYLSKNLLLKKPYVPSIGTNPATNLLNYPLCSKQFIELYTETTLQNKSQLLKLKIYTDELTSYLRNLSDFFIANRTSVSNIEFHMDISLKDSSMVGASVSRINLNISLLQRARDVKNKVILYYFHNP